MDLKEIRKKFVELSGRYDLVVDTTDYEDAGADFYIREGSKFLDRRAEITESEAIKFKNVSEGDFYVTFDLCRTIHEVWFYDAGERGQLKDATRKELLTKFPKLLSTMETGVPAMYLPINVRIADGSDTPPIGFLEYVDIEGEELTGIIFPPLDRDGIMSIVGKFYSAELVSNASTNYWSSNHSMLLVWAALYHVEISYRNTEGAKDWLSAITLHLDDLFKDRVEQESGTLKQLGGRDNE